MPTDEDLLLSGDPEDFGLFYDRYVDMLLGYFARRVHDPEVAADLTAETFAAALAARRRFRRTSTPAVAWLFGIAQHKLTDYRRRGAAEDRMRRRLGIERVPVGDDDREMIAMLGRDAAWQLIDELPPEQRDAVRAHVLDDRPYPEIAAAAGTSEAVVRKRVSRGLSALRAAAGAMSDFVTALREELVQAAEREQARRLPHWHRPAPRLVLAGVAAVAMALIVLLAAGALTTRAPDDERQAAPREQETRELFGGTLQPDVRYRTRAFVPALTFEVSGRDWQAGDTTQSDVLILDHGEGFFDPGVERRPPGGLWFTRVLEVYEPTVRSLPESLAAAPTDLHAWMQAHPDLRAGASRPVTVAGVRGERFDVEVRFRRPSHGDPRCRERFQVTCTALSPRLSFQDHTLLRVTVLRTEPEPLVIMLEHFTRAGLRDLEEAAAPVLDSLRITPR